MRWAVGREGRPNLADWTRFRERTFARVEQGKRDYKDTSFTRPFHECIDEAQQEAEDVMGWNFVACSRADCPPEVREELEQISADAFALWVRLERIREALL